MENEANSFGYQVEEEMRIAKSRAIRTYLTHGILFVLTFFTTTLAGVQWLIKDPLDFSNFHLGLPYSVSILAFLSAHEFGHFFAARYHGVRTTLPYYIPFPPFLINFFGTMGAVIRIRSPLSSKRALFDIGVAGPLAGLVVIVIILCYGLLTLPNIEYLYSIHPDYRLLDRLPQSGLTFGNSLLFWGLTNLLSGPVAVPPMNEVYHYPYLCVGWFGLFVTALNLIPVGQLDGGHVLYAIIGKRQGLIARGFFFVLIGIGIAGFLPFISNRMQTGSLGWLIWSAILFFIIKIDHPVVDDPSDIGLGRKILGWITFVIFLITFPPIPFFELTPN